MNLIICLEDPHLCRSSLRSQGRQHSIRDSLASARLEGTGLWRIKPWQICPWVHTERKVGWADDPSVPWFLVNLCPFRNSHFFRNYMAPLAVKFPELHVVCGIPAAPQIPVGISTGSPRRLCHEPSFNDIQRMKSANLRTLGWWQTQAGIHCRMALCQNAVCWAASNRKQSVDV